MLWAQLRYMLFLSLRRTGRNTICSLGVLLEKSFFLSGEKKSNPIPFLCVFFSYLYKREEIVGLPSCLMMVFPVIVTFLLWRLPSVIYHVVISLRWTAMAHSGCQLKTYMCPRRMFSNFRGWNRFLLHALLYIWSNLHIYT